MGRMVKDAKLQSVESRAKLKPQHEPYWRLISEGVHLGYRKGLRGGVWIGRTRVGDTYRKVILGNANDVIDASKEGFLTFSEAQKAATEMLQTRATTKSFTVGDAIDRYLEWFRANRKSINTTETVIAAHIAPTWKSQKLSELRTEDIRNWHQALAKKPARKRARKGAGIAYREPPADDNAKRARKATANRILVIFKAILNKAYEDDLVATQDAWRKVKPFSKADEPVIRFLRAHEASRLINRCEPAFRRLVQAALNTGARYSEIAGLRVADFAPENASIYVRPSKTARGRHVPLSPEGIALFDAASIGKKGTDLLFARPNGAPWKKNDQVRPLLAACAAAKIEPAITFHELRHTVGSSRVDLQACKLEYSIVSPK